MRTSRLGTVLLALVVAPAVLVGCSSGGSSGGSEPPSAAPSTGAPSAATTATQDAAAAEAARKETFCTEVPGLLTGITADLQSLQAPEDARRVLGEAVDRIAAVEPPAGAEAEWERLVAAWTGMRDLLGEADLRNPEANAALAPRLQELQTELVDSGAAIDAYGKAHC
ncbi:hypothetical protein [Modestobacter lapidis]|nr:hypothetical protein [Modestobacter lapidis]